MDKAMEAAARAVAKRQRRTVCENFSRCFDSGRCGCRVVAIDAITAWLAEPDEERIERVATAIFSVQLTTKRKLRESPQTYNQMARAAIEALPE